MTVDIFSADRSADAQRRPGRAGVRLLEAVEEFQDGVPAHEQPVARRAIVAPARTFECGTLTLPPSASIGHPFAWIVLEGILLRRTYLGTQPGAELLGEGDIIDLRGDADAWSLPGRTEYLVHRTANVAVLDDRFRAAARRWPGLLDVLVEQQAAQSRRASRQLAGALGLSRVEDRLVAFFSDLADRWGRVTPDGVVIDVPLTHTLLGELAGSRRPTVSLALAELSAKGTVVRRPDHSWLLAHEVTAAA